MIEGIKLKGDPKVRREKLVKSWSLWGLSVETAYMVRGASEWDGSFLSAISSGLPELSRSFFRAFVDMLVYNVSLSADRVSFSTLPHTHSSSSPHRIIATIYPLSYSLPYTSLCRSCPHRTPGSRARCSPTRPPSCVRPSRRCSTRRGGSAWTGWKASCRSPRSRRGRTLRSRRRR